MAPDLVVYEVVVPRYADTNDLDPLCGRFTPWAFVAHARIDMSQAERVRIELDRPEGFICEQLLWIERQFLGGWGEQRARRRGFDELDVYLRVGMDDDEVVMLILQE